MDLLQYFYNLQLKSIGVNYMNNFTKINIESLSRLDTITLSEIEKLSASCGGYEVFADCGTPCWLALTDNAANNCIGIITFIVTENDGFTEIEVAAMVHPNWRNKGIFTALLAKARNNILSVSNQPKRIIAALPEYLTRSDICRGYAYSELLLKCDTPVSTVISPANMDGYYDYEAFFSDDNMDFLLYHKDEDEPCAVCSLDYCKSYTNIYGVYVDEKRRKQKIGSLLMQNLLEKYFKEYNVPLILNVRSTNTAAVKLYKKFGFEEESKVDYYYL